jgi:Zn-dependent protease with chaperone function
VKIVENIKKYAAILAVNSQLVQGSGIFPDEEKRSHPENLQFSDIILFIKYAISVLLALAGVVAMVYIIIGGYRYMTAMGNEEQIKTAKTTMIWAVLGFIIVACAWLIVNEIWNLFHGGTIDTLP